MVLKGLNTKLYLLTIFVKSMQCYKLYDALFLSGMFRIKGEGLKVQFSFLWNLSKSICNSFTK